MAQISKKQNAGRPARERKLHMRIQPPPSSQCDLQLRFLDARLPQAEFFDTAASWQESFMFETVRNVKAVTIVMRSALTVAQPSDCIRFSVLLPCVCLPGLSPFGLLFVFVRMWFRGCHSHGNISRSIQQPSLRSLALLC